MTATQILDSCCPLASAEDQHRLWFRGCGAHLSTSRASERRKPRTNPPILRTPRTPPPPQKHPTTPSKGSLVCHTVSCFGGGWDPFAIGCQGGRTITPQELHNGNQCTNAVSGPMVGPQSHIYSTDGRPKIGRPKPHVAPFGGYFRVKKGARGGSGRPILARPSRDARTGHRATLARPSCTIIAQILGRLSHRGSGDRSLP